MMGLNIKCLPAVIVTVLVATYLATDAYSQLGIPGYYQRPLSPFSPTDQKQCDSLENEWQPIRKRIDAEHQECLDSMMGKPKNNSGGSCDYAECQSLHGAALLGVAEVDDCRKAVRTYQEQQRKAESDRQEYLRTQDAATQAARTKKDEHLAESSNTGQKRTDRESDSTGKIGEKDDAETALVKLRASLEKYALEQSRIDRDLLEQRTKEREAEEKVLEEKLGNARQEYDERIKAGKEPSQIVSLFDPKATALARAPAESPQSLLSAFDVSAPVAVVQPSEVSRDSLLPGPTVKLGGATTTEFVELQERPLSSFGYVEVNYTCDKTKKSIAVISQVFAACYQETSHSEIAKGQRMTYYQVARASCGGDVTFDEQISSYPYTGSNAESSSKKDREKDVSDSIRSGYKVESVFLQTPYSSKCR
jgi:hypothetical protein